MKLRPKKVVQPYDIWTNEDSKKKSSKLHPSFKRNKKNPLPHPGQSYNPDPTDHERLLKKILKKELDFQKKAKSLNKAVGKQVDLKELQKHEKEEIVSGIKHLIKKDDLDSDNSGSSTDEAFSDYDEKDFQAILKDKKVVERRKSRQQRLKQMRDKLQRKAAKLRKLKNIRLSKFDSIKKITKELNKRDKEAAKVKKGHKKIKTERLGQKFEQSDPIYCLSGELPTNLRQVSCPMDAIVREQLESFQSRLLVEPTKFQLKRNRRFKNKEFERKNAADEEG